MKINPIHNFAYYRNNVRFASNIQAPTAKNTIENLIGLGYLDRAIELGATDEQIRNICHLPTEDLYASYMTQQKFKERQECLSVLTQKLISEDKINKAIRVCSDIENDYEGLKLTPTEVFALSKDTLQNLINLKTQNLKNSIIAIGSYIK